MEPAEKTRLISTINGEITELEHSITTLKPGAEPIAPDNAIGRLSRMEAINSKAVTETSIARMSLRKQRLQTALNRIDEPQFGICEDCQKTIPMGRMLVVPESTSCVACMES